MALDTLFAPAERAEENEIQHDAQVLAEAGIVNHLTYIIPSILMVLNKERQVVYSNQRLIDLLSIDSDHAILGLRPGEILDCIHAHNTCGGCGTTEFCSQCGAIKAILKSQNEKVGVEAECRITKKNGEALELKIWASPFKNEDSDFTILSILDIQNEKRRQALEQTFFHDMTNLLSSITGHTDLINETDSTVGKDELIKAIQTASSELIAEINGHRKLQLAEKGKLQVELTPLVNSEKIINELMGLYPYRKIQVAENTEHFSATTDRTILFRVVLNMLKNALEASESNETITISCRKESESGIFSIHNPAFMPRETQLQIFQRSFTTKGMGHGIGTYSMRLFGEKYLKGKVGFTTSKQNGTTFYIAIPLSYPDEFDAH